MASSSGLRFEFLQLCHQALHVSMIVDLLTAQAFTLKLLLQRADLVTNSRDLRTEVAASCRCCRRRCCWSCGGGTCSRSRSFEFLQLRHQFFYLIVIVDFLAAQAFTL